MARNTYDHAVAIFFLIFFFDMFDQCRVMGRGLGEWSLCPPRSAAVPIVQPKIYRCTGSFTDVNLSG